MNKRLAVLLDFDGTLTQRDLGEQLLDAFADSRWRNEAVAMRAGRVSFKVMNEREFAYLPADKRQKMEKYATEHARLRDGALELVSYCEEKGIPVEIVSGGLDFYIRAVLTKFGLGHLPVLCLKQADFTKGNGVVVGYPDGVAVCETTGACKCSRLWSYQERGYRVLFIGDGSSDRCIAAKADVLYARGSLARFCSDQGIPFTEYESLNEVTDSLHRLLEA